MVLNQVEKAIAQVQKLADGYAAEGGPRSRRHAILCRKALAHLGEAARELAGVSEREVAAPAEAKPEKP